MQLDLTSDEARLLRATLHDYLPDLQRETARTEERTMPHELVQRQELVERLLERLERVTA